MLFRVPVFVRSPEWIRSSPEGGRRGYLECVSLMQVMGMGSWEGGGL